MSKLISIRDDLYEKLKEFKGYNPERAEDTYSFSEVLDMVLEPLQETTVTQEGRFIGSKALAGKTILYKAKGEKE